MSRRRHRYVLVPDGPALDRRLIPSAFLGYAAPIGHDPLPEPEPPPGTDPGPSAPITLPPMAPSGPIGPGTS